MLEVVTDAEAKAALQAQLEQLVRRAWPRKQVRRIVWRPDGIDLPISHDGEHWFAPHVAGEGAGIRRYWNSFGDYRADGSLQITVEINIPLDSNSRQVSGFFARDPETGVAYLMHDGGVGGGRKGIGKDAFLAWSNLLQIEVHEDGREPRRGIIVAPLDAASLDGALTQFVGKVSAFKQAVGEGYEVPVVESPTGGETMGDYFPEPTGLRKGERQKHFEYITRHGDIVDALRHWASQRFPQGRVVKDRYIDLGIEQAGCLACLFEVKTSAARQVMYTAVGQLSVHAPAHNVARYVVVPDGESMATDIRACLDRLNVRVLTYELDGRTVTIR